MQRFVLKLCFYTKRIYGLLFHYHDSGFYYFLDVVLNIFQSIKYSAHGSNDKKKEEATFGFFVDYLDECEKGKLTSVVN